MVQQAISNDPVLDEIILELSPAREVYDGDTHQPIPGLRKREFVFSCPYRITDMGLFPTRSFGRSFFDVGFSSKATKDEVKAVHVHSYTERYLRHAGHFNEDTRLVLTQVVEALYAEPQPALDGLGPLNAFKSVGVLYMPEK
ncbi:MAG TPA: hypothetical protein VJI15_06245 [Candidatus Nanoarchaeia archaeon]|nr:hypothetical protein [Candidatus Nanoarchaeia archaeon]